LLSEAMRRLAANIDRTRTVVLFGNRLFEATAADPKGTAPGGRALRFSSSVRLAMQRGALIRSALGFSARPGEPFWCETAHPVVAGTSRLTQ